VVLKTPRPRSAPEKAEWDIVFLCKLLMTGHGVGTDPNDLAVSILEQGELVPEGLVLSDAARSEVYERRKSDGRSLEVHIASKEPISTHLWGRRR